MPLGAKILLPIFAITFLIAMGAGVFFTLQQVGQDRVAKDQEGRTVATVVQGTLQGNAVSQDPTTLFDLLRHINLAYPDVAAICVLTAGTADPFGPLMVFAASQPLTTCDPASPVASSVRVIGVQSRTRMTATGALEETATGADITSVGRSAVIEVLVPVTPFADLAMPTFAKSAGSGLLLAFLQTGIVFLVLWFSALRPLKRLRLAAQAAARAAQPSSPSDPTSVGRGDEIAELSMRFHEMLTAVNDRERQLVESHSQVETLISNVPVTVFSAGRDGKMLQLKGSGTEAALTQFGHGRLEDVTLLEIAGRNGEISRLFRRALTGEKVHEVVMVEGWLDAAATEPTYIDVIINPIFDGERRFAGITGLALNVSDRVDAASARAESQQKSAFLAAMSHELRTPLNSIMGFSQLLALAEAKPALTPKQKRYVAHILSSGSHLLGLIGDILDLAKAGAGQLTVNLEPVPLLELIIEPVDQTRPLALQKKIAIDVQLPPGLVAFTDLIRVRQMLLNLISNAVKFTPEGGPNVLVSGRAVGNGGVEISVADSGIGIAREHLETIFDEFTQVDRGPTRSLDGTGLGLTLVSRLASLIGGTVRVESAIGVGSTFVIWLPGVPVEKPAVELAATAVVVPA